MILTEDQANQVWAILITTCGAGDDDMRQQFVRHSGNTHGLEFRFCGDLGFGGKIYVQEPPQVNCYIEDTTTQREEMIAAANEQLCLLWRDWEKRKKTT